MPSIATIDQLAARLREVIPETSGYRIEASLDDTVNPMPPEGQWLNVRDMQTAWSYRCKPDGTASEGVSWSDGMAYEPRPVVLDEVLQWWIDKVSPVSGECLECGEDTTVDDSGVSHHYSSDGLDGIDHELDADHVAVPRV